MLFEKYQHFDLILDLILKQNPLQKKRIIEFVQTQDEIYLDFADNLSMLLYNRVFNKYVEQEVIIKSYNQTCMELLREQIKFKKTGKYSAVDSNTVKSEVYDNKEKMKRYIIGLLLSYLFWPNHYGIIRFFQDCLNESKITNYLEIGAGHGLFTVETLKKFPKTDCFLVDISETSLEVTEELLRAYNIDIENVNFVNNDFLNIEKPFKGYDFIVMGEVLEHIEDPIKFLNKAKMMLEENGVIFLSTCANCPAVDHIYHFHCVDEIRQHIKDAGLLILKENITPLERIPEVDWVKEKVSINYSALVKCYSR
jgi:2-polyprenyl-3-methyl-5-hydroxy-6-metoxy-1,4-benzoquinol methylase